MSNTLASTILDTIRDSLRLHVGFCRWSDDVGNLFWVVSARNNDGEQWIRRHEDFYLVVCGLAELVRFELRDGAFCSEQSRISRGFRAGPRTRV